MQVQRSVYREDHEQFRTISALCKTAAFGATSPRG